MPIATGIGYLILSEAETMRTNKGLWLLLDPGYSRLLAELLYHNKLVWPRRLSSLLDLTLDSSLDGSCRKHRLCQLTRHPCCLNGVLLDWLL